MKTFTANARGAEMTRVQELEEALRKVIDLKAQYYWHPEQAYAGLDQLTQTVITPLLLKGQDNDNNS